MKLITSLALVVTFAAACKKEDKPAPSSPPVEPAGSAGSAAVAPPPAPDPAGSAAAAPVASADYISVFGNHAEKKPQDPVEVKFPKFAVTKASFDPANLEGGTATIEIDLASLSSGSDKRDGHLKSASYIDLAKFTTVTIDVSNVKKKDATHYSADAKVKFRDIEKTYPVALEVLETTADSVKIKAAQPFARADFGIGQAEPGPEESVAKELELRLQLTLKKT